MASRPASEAYGETIPVVRALDDVVPEDPGLILFTGGTTGLSKAAYATHQALVMAGMQIRAWFHSALVEWDDCFLGSLPLFHVFGLVPGLWLPLSKGFAIAAQADPRDGDALGRLRHG